MTKGTVRASRAGTQEGAIWEEPGPADPRSSSLQGMHEKLVLLAQQGCDCPGESLTLWWHSEVSYDQCTLPKEGF